MEYLIGAEKITFVNRLIHFVSQLKSKGYYSVAYAAALLGSSVV